MNKKQAKTILKQNEFGSAMWKHKRHYSHKVYVRYELLAEELEAINTLVMGVRANDFMKCKECNGKLKLKKTLFNQSPSMKKRFKEQFGKELPEPQGYNCINCGACYDKHFKREKHNLLWLSKKS